MSKDARSCCRIFSASVHVLNVRGQCCLFLLRANNILGKPMGNSKPDETVPVAGMQKNLDVFLVDGIELDRSRGQSQCYH